MKFTPFGIVAALALGGCQANLTLEQAQALCTKQGGLLTVIYTQQITASGIGAPVGTPGECISPNKFEANPPAPAAAAPPAK